MADDARRQHLVERLSRLMHREEALKKHLRGEDGRLEADFSDRVAFTEMDEVIEGLDDATRDEIRQLRHALERIDAGKGDTCDVCGDPIGEGRMRAVPTATRCVDCAA